MAGSAQLFFSRESSIRRDAEGRWFHDGLAVENDAVSRAFDRWVTRGDDGRYRLENTVNWVYVEIEGAPIFVERVRVEDGRVMMELSDERVEALAPETLRQDERGVLYCDVRGGVMPARFLRKAQAMLEPLVGDDESGVYLELGGLRVRPPVVADPLRVRR